VAKLFAYARFQLHVQQAQLQELQQQHDTTLHQQHYHCQVRPGQIRGLRCLLLRRKSVETCVLRFLLSCWDAAGCKQVHDHVC
jgi:hypothetical protein